METTPRANRPHIAVFGRRNVGKSSLINALTNQELAVVSEVAGTTTDPVYKAMELLPLGPVVMIDTAGIDDTGTLGEMRVKKTKEVIRRTDLALLITDTKQGVGEYEQKLYRQLRTNKIPVIPVINKTDKGIEWLDETRKKLGQLTGEKVIKVSAKIGTGIEDLREYIADVVPKDAQKETIIGDLIEANDKVILVTPIDSAAPKGRLILPQVQTIRDIIDHNGIALVCKETELIETLDSLKTSPRLVVTDSQAFGQVARIVPEEITLTSFSILFARYKGDLDIFVDGILQLERLQPGDDILVAEACTHRRQKDDIGTVKILRWLQKRVGNLNFDHVSGREYSEDLGSYDLVLHCGGCMLNRKEVLSRLREAKHTGVPVVNYGMTIAWIHGILDRALEPFPAIKKRWLERQETINVS